MRFLLTGSALLVVAPLLFGQQPGMVLPPSGKTLPGNLPSLKAVPGFNSPKVEVQPPASRAVPNFAPPLNNEMTSFDPQRAQLIWTNGNWELEAGKVRLKDFGTKERDARDALNLIRQLRLSQHGAIGHPLPIMEYWLADGKAPHAFGGGMRLYPIDRATLRVESIQNQWCVLDDHRLLFNFGPLEQDAQQALAVIRSNGFDRIGYVGSPQPTMIYFVAGQAGFGGTSSLNPPSIAPLPIPKGDKEETSVPTVKLPEIKGQKSPIANLNPLLLQQVQLSAKGMQQLAPPPLVGLSHFRFSPYQLSVRDDHGKWKLYADQRVLANFSGDAKQARVALQLMQHYGCTEQCTIGLPTPTFSFFLSNGHAPLGIHHDLHGRQFQPEQINVRQFQKDWFVCEGSQPLLFFGERKEDAQELAQAVKKYHFDCIGQFGPPGQPVMSILVRTK